MDLTEPKNLFLRYFEYHKGASYAKCSLCRAKLGRKQSNTSGMRKHLKASIKQTHKKQAKLEFRPIKKWASNHLKSMEIDEKILRYICLSLQPLLLPEKDGFSDMIDALNPRF